MNRSLSWIVCGLSLAWTFPEALARDQGRFDRLYVFGDSLSSTHNAPDESGRYFEGNLSNGPLWPQSISPALGFPYDPSRNFADTSATTAAVLEQATQFSPRTKTDCALFVVWAVSNDFRDIFFSGLNDKVWSDKIDEAVANLRATAELLIAKGARTVVIPNAVDVSRLPALAGLPPVFQNFVRGKVAEFNQKLSLAITDLDQHSAPAQVMTLDIFTRFNVLLNEPAKFGFTRTTVDVLGDTSLTDKSFDGPGKDYFFWDVFHPTSKANVYVAQWLIEALIPPSLALTMNGSTVEVLLENLSPDSRYALERTVDFSRWAEMSTFQGSATQHWSGSVSRVPKAFFRLRSIP